MQGALVDGKGEMWHSLAHHTIMFSLLADKLDNTFRRLRGLGKISEKNIADALRDIRLALLEADVEFGVAREFHRSREGTGHGAGSAQIHQARRANRRKFSVMKSPPCWAGTPWGWT